VDETVVITGAFSYTGKYTTRILLDRGYRVRTLTFHPGRPNPFGDRVEVHPYHFDRPAQLRRSLEGASTLINTYWVRFPHNGIDFAAAVRNSKLLIHAASDAGLHRIVHVSIANPSLDSPLGYYKGKAEVEQAVRESRMSHAIVRPTVIFGAEDILINNIAWFLRRLPVFGVPGNGHCGIRPIYVEDMARLLVDSIEATANCVTNAVGPETFEFDDLVRLIAREVGSSVWVVHLPAPLAYLGTLVTGWIVHDVVLTWQEYGGLLANLLAPDGAAVGETRLSQWLAANRASVGRKYASEVKRHFRVQAERDRFAR